jgi:hypothetical protein
VTNREGKSPIDFARETGPLPRSLSYALICSHAYTLHTHSHIHSIHTRDTTGSLATRPRSAD